MPKRLGSTKTDTNKLLNYSTGTSSSTADDETWEEVCMEWPNVTRKRHLGQATNNNLLPHCIAFPFEVRACTLSLHVCTVRGLLPTITMIQWVIWPSLRKSTSSRMSETTCCPSRRVLAGLVGGPTARGRRVNLRRQHADSDFNAAGVCDNGENRITTAMRMKEKGEKKRRSWMAYLLCTPPCSSCFSLRSCDDCLLVLFNLALFSTSVVG